MPEKVCRISGRELSVKRIRAIVCSDDLQIEIDRDAYPGVTRSNQFIDSHLQNKIIYGINTGFGPMATHRIAHQLLTELQYNLVRSHASGVGHPIDQRYVLASMVIRLNTLTKGYSGVSVHLLEQLRDFINHRIIPVVPEHGAVGTSGDLVQLAHIALALIGEGEVFYRGQRHPTARILERLKIQPYKLQPKEGLALINGTSVMTGVASLLVIHAQCILGLAVRSGAMALELLNGFSDSIAERMHDLRPHLGQRVVAGAIRQILATSRQLQDREVFQKNHRSNTEPHEIPNGVQEVYSIRCTPQILGPVYDIIQKTRRDVETEMNSVSDNPIVDAEAQLFLHGGNFHGDYIAAAVDQLKAGIVKLTMLSERRINYLLHDKLNKRFPPFLNLHTPGLTLGLQGLQFVATSTAALSQSYAYPHHLHSIPTNGDNQDVVSMGTDAALMAAKVIDHAYIVLAIEFVALAQAVDFLKNHEQLSETSRQLYHEVRQLVPVVKEDRTISSELEAVVNYFKNGIADDRLVV